MADGGVTDLTTGWETGLTSVGRLTGLWSADLLLVQVIMMSRLPPLENAFGRDQLTRMPPGDRFPVLRSDAGPRRDDPRRVRRRRWSLVPGTTWELITTGGGILLSVAGLVALCLVAATSIKKARGRLRYESWHLIHLYAYLGVGLALPHQLWTGQQFLSSPGRTVFWWTLWAAAAGAIVVWRVALPLVRSLRHGLRVTSVHRESSDVVSVYLTGRRLDRLPVRAGQFLNVRFLDGPGWSRANPFSLSAAPDGRSLRITAKALGDGSARLAHLRPGTRVLFEGPYGRLSSRARTRPKVLLAGAGVGITPLRALAEGLAYAPGDAVLLRPLHRRTAVRRRAAGPDARSRGSRSSGCPVRVSGPTPSSARPAAATSWPRCCAGSPTWPSATSSSAGRRPGPPASHASWSPPAYRVPVSTPRALVGEPMKRIVLWLASTVTIVVLLFGYHTSTNSAAPASASGGAARAEQQRDRGGRTPPDPSSDPTAGPSSSPSTSSSSGGSSSSAAKTYTGDVAQTRWGPVQVEITVTSGTITAVDVVQYPNGQQQGPGDQRLRAADPGAGHVQAQSAKIDMVSGATVTSDGYVESLQSALDQAGM